MGTTAADKNLKGAGIPEGGGNRFGKFCQCSDNYAFAWSGSLPITSQWVVA